MHADGKVPRFREEDFRLLSTYGPQDEAHVADWPLTYDELEPFYAEVEKTIGVSGRAGANPWGATGLEWTTSSPPTKHNFERTPIVKLGPYSYNPEDSSYISQEGEQHAG